jgi:hypothetical protein
MELRDHGPLCNQPTSLMIRVNDVLRPRPSGSTHKQVHLRPDYRRRRTLSTHPVSIRTPVRDRRNALTTRRGGTWPVARWQVVVRSEIECI